MSAISNFFSKNKSIIQFVAVALSVVFVSYILYTVFTKADSFGNIKKAVSAPLATEPSQMSATDKGYIEQAKIYTESAPAKWAKKSPGPSMPGNYIPPKLQFGINTISTPRKNANLQLRPDPYVPIDETRQYYKSSIMPDPSTRRVGEL